MSAQITAEEMANSLTGYDELAISKHFGGEVGDLAEHRQTTFIRALVFVDFTRQGKGAPEAKKAAMDLTLGQCNSYFSEVEDAESGEGETPSD